MPTESVCPLCPLSWIASNEKGNPPKLEECKYFLLPSDHRNAIVTVCGFKLRTCSS